MSVGYYARGKQLARPLLFGINDMDDDILVRDPSVAFAHLSGKFGGGLNTRHHREEREKREAQRLALIAGINKLPTNIVDTLINKYTSTSICGGLSHTPQHPWVRMIFK